ncbi:MULTISPECIES: uroporphyrinogen-III C-methyltransferase [Roseateles]|uniref:Uroporphyrinogen-III C-methyltransferase n=1 Tax=Pelomonas caseinilytica TaxID=2906763 RepID=A0ABS8XAW1_9BURK|nr:uroporphyrinogen-III C-methyltransferase [Roseateles sp.]MCE4536828.1 uroporphyrinogen-III C-methyltransferase [Pelomonas sp. P7]HEV6966756.1 uroporphyrinogen-III C-methyltransferase [Roseateles sp.]
MTEPTPPIPAEAAALPPPSPPTPAPPTIALPGWMPWLLALMGVALLACLALAWQSLSRQQSLERELVRRQEASAAQATEARLAAKQSAELVRDTAAKVSLLDARLAEVALQRGQLEELIQSMSRSRDENVVGDIEAAIRVALQQTQITGSAEPLVATLKQADERLLRYKQPRMEGVRRAVARDLDRVKAVAVVDVSTLTIKLDEVVRMADELPLVSGNEAAPRPRGDDRNGEAARERERALKLQREQAAAAADGKLALWWWQASQQLSSWTGVVWGEARTLLRVTRIEHPEAALISPDQSFFLRENLKLRLLNARLALLSRQFDTAQSDLRDCQDMLNRYFDMRSRKVAGVGELLRQVAGQARQVSVPRPDDTLAALTAAAAGR